MRHISNDLAGKNILITGGGGFIGSNLAFYFQDQHPAANITVFDCFRTGEYFPSGNPTSFGDERNIEGFKGQITRGNINHRNDIRWIKDQKFDIIFHQAAISDTTVEDETIMMQSNVEAFRQILEASRLSNAKVIYASSAGTYGNSPPPNRVGHGEHPTNVYGASKLKMDRVAEEFCRDNPTAHVVGLRYFNVYGEREYLKGKTASMILQLGLQALKHKKVRLFKYGEQKRDFIYIQDIIQANVKALESKKTGVFNVGTGISRTFNHIVEGLKQQIGDFEVEYFDNPYAFYQNHTEADISETRSALAYEPAFSLESGIQSYISEIQLIHEGKLYR